MKKKTVDFSWMDAYREEVSPLYEEGRALFEDAQIMRLDGNHEAVADRFFKILELYNQIDKAHERHAPKEHRPFAKGCAAAYRALVYGIRHQLANPLSKTPEKIKAWLEDWRPFTDERPLTPQEIIHQKRKILALHLAGGVTGHSDTTYCVYITGFEDTTGDLTGYRWGKKPLDVTEPFVNLGPLDGRGIGYFLLPWGEEIGAWLAAHPEECVGQIPTSAKARAELFENITRQPISPLYPWKQIILDRLGPACKPPPMLMMREATEQPLLLEVE